jgi:hypothetical protein
LGREAVWLYSKYGEMRYPGVGLDVFGMRSIAAEHVCRIVTTLWIRGD